ncbi:MAG: hypothetical protein ACYCWW_19355, partial [Deltaproteobacteria bacterium]
DRRHPLRAQAFVQWAADHPNEGLDAFVASHSDWPVIPRFLLRYRPAVEAFLGWASDHPAAARELVSKPRELAWAGFHPFKADWQPELSPPAPVQPAAVHGD